jgi:hypothetical protein
MCGNEECIGDPIFSVDKETLEKTTKCEKKGCLYDETIMCRVERAIKTDLLFVQADPLKCSCNYCVTFGDSFMCLCPTRQEIYLKYGK